jgi:DinB superfamily
MIMFSAQIPDPMPAPLADASVARVFQSEAGPTKKLSMKSTSPARAKTLDELEAQFIAMGATAQALVDAAGAELCTQRPSPGSWSVAECLQHLNISADAYFPIWQQVIANAGPRKTEMNSPYHTDFWGGLLSWILLPPARIRSRTPFRFEPVEVNSIESGLSGFLERQQRIVATLRRCRGRSIDQVKMASPVEARIRYSIWSSFLVNAAHQRRHLWQAENAVRKLHSVNPQSA